MKRWIFPSLIQHEKVTDSCPDLTLSPRRKRGGGVAGNSDGMPPACGAAKACKPLRALQGRGCGSVLCHAASILLCVCVSLCVSASHAAPNSFSFSVIGQNASRDDAKLHESIKRATLGKSSFIVLNGVRPHHESCSDDVFLRRKKILDEVEMPLIVSLSASDWAECKNEKGESSAQERLSFVRGLLFDTEYSFGSTKIQVVRQSLAAKFRNYAENSRWVSGGILFATINIPGNNNHYLAAAGRNNEFEDRLTANRVWLQRIFTHAKSHRIKGIVLFADGNPLAATARPNRAEGRDGFVEMRKQLTTLTARFQGRVLLVHGQQSSGNITLRDNLGTVGAGKYVLNVVVKPGTAMLFSVSRSGGDRKRK
jgi:hypothetical protein